MKYVLIAGGVVSELGKSVTASNLGVVLQSCGLRVTSIKIDPYLNTDAGTMSPFEHGEVFVLDDDGEGSRTHIGSTMRLGSRRTLFVTLDCITSKLLSYGYFKFFIIARYCNSHYVDERHWHRYEVNSEIISNLEEEGLKFVGKDETGQRMEEILELQGHPFYIGVQFHPETRVQIKAWETVLYWRP